MPLLMLLLLSCLTLCAQDARRVCVLAGATDTRVQHEGRLSATEFEGRWSLSVGPDQRARFYGLTVRDLEGAHPRELVLKAHWSGAAPAQFQLRLEDDEGMRGNDAAAWIEQTLKPGWNELKVNITALKSRGNSRALDLTHGLRRIRLSRRADQQAGVLSMESVAFSGESIKPASAASVAETVAAPVSGERRRNLLALLAKAGPQKAAELAFQWLRADEQARCIARAWLQSVDDPQSVQRLMDACLRPSAERVELLTALGNHHSPMATACAEKLLADQRLSEEERAALVRALARQGRWNPLLNERVPANAAWPLRAALLQAALHADCDAAVETLISLCGSRECARVSGPAIAALCARLGTDLGHDAAAWTELWKARRGALPGATPRASSYGSFYGIPLDPGRIVFVIDGSGSMREVVRGGKAAEYIGKSDTLRTSSTPVTRLDLLKAELLTALSKLPSGTQVGIVFFNDEALWLTKGLEALDDATRERMASRVRSVNAGQKTNIHAGLWQAFHPTGKPLPADALQGPDTIVVLTDGAPSAGIVKDALVLADAVLRWNLGRFIRIHSVNVGDRASRWMKLVSAATGGVHQDLSSDRSEEGQNQ